MTAENLVLMLHNLIGVDGAGRVDFGSHHHPRPEIEYGEQEARAAFMRVAMDHGWNPGGGGAGGGGGRGGGRGRGGGFGGRFGF